MSWTTRSILTILSTALVAAAVPPAHAGGSVPEWVRPAVRYLDDQGYLDRDSFYPNRTMSRAAFKRLMSKAFGGGYRRERGVVTAGEVSAALVRRLGRGPIAKSLNAATSPDGWDPEVSARFGSEVVARELGLRRDRPSSEETMEASVDEAMRQADIAWAVWRAKTAPSLYAADALSRFGLRNYNETKRKVVKVALSLVGSPYVWGGDWPVATGSGYPYGAQSHGGFDCSGFIWYVLQKKSSGYRPMNRPYEGWSIPQRSSYDMAGAIGARKRLAFDELKPADLVFFAPGGRGAKASSVYHAGLYLGKGWMIHSSGSRAGISLAEIGPGSWWNDQLAWGRRIVTG